MVQLENTFKRSQIKKINQGTYFKLKPSESAPVWVRGEYIKSERKYSCYKYSDTNHEKFMEGDKGIYIDFTF